MADNFQIRPASPADLGALVALEQASFSDAWTAPQLASALAHLSTLGLVLTTAEETVAGYLIGRTVSDEAEVLTLAVDPAFRRRGLGRRLLEAAMEAMLERGIATIWLEVRQSNEAAQALYLGAGFVATGLRRGYYRRPVEDALVLKCDLSTIASVRSPLR